MLETFAAVMTGGTNGNNQREGCCCTSYNTQNRELQQNVIQSKIYRAKFEKGYYCPVTQSCPTLCNLMDCSMSGLSVLHYLPEFAQTHVHWEKATAPHSSTLAWKIPWTEEPGRLQSMESTRVGHDWVTSLSLFSFMHWRRKWQPTPVFLPRESQGRRSLVGCHLWGCTELDTTEAT